MTCEECGATEGNRAGWIQRCSVCQRELDRTKDFALLWRRVELRRWRILAPILADSPGEQK